MSEQVYAHAVKLGLLLACIYARSGHAIDHSNKKKKLSSPNLKKPFNFFMSPLERAKERGRNGNGGRNERKDRRQLDVINLEFFFFILE
jgi:hypothetical protein